MYQNKEEFDMRNFVVKYGSIVVNILAIITLIALCISTVTVIMAQGFWAGLGVLWAGIVSFVFVFFTIYLIMSINEHLENIENRSSNRY